MLDIRSLVAGYEGTAIVDDISLSLSAGEVVGILGRNGVGKTTFLRSIFGLCQVFSGEVCLDGERLPTRRPELRARKGLSFMPDDRGVFASLTIEENLRLARRRDYKPPLDVCELFPLLRERSAQPAGQLSGGQQQQVGLARAILAGSRMIAVDELSRGLQPSIVEGVAAALRQLAATGVAIVIVEQSPEAALALCDRIVVMVKGRVALDDRVETLRRSLEQFTDLLVVG